MTARTPPTEVELRDLRSRLRAVPAVQLRPPDDHLFRALIVKFCADRQLAGDEAVVGSCASHIERSYAALRQAIELLDIEALRLGSPVTRALAAELFRQPRLLWVAPHLDGPRHGNVNIRKRPRGITRPRPFLRDLR